ncbi:MAG: hypothetical protein LCH98_19360 [Actinobacteria bacterium]|nr:hypothetical protein [Actinomycetota bacterium]
MGQATGPNWGSPAPLRPPGPPPAAPSGPLYGARYGDPAYEAHYGSTLGAAGSGPDPHSPAPGGARAHADRAAAGRLTFRPGVVTLRPASMGDLLDAAVRTLRLRPALFLGIGALAVVLLTVLRAAVDAMVGVTLLAADGTAGLRITPSLALVPVVGALLAGVLALPTADAVLGRDPTGAGVRRQLRPRLPRLLGYVALVAVACLVPTFLAWFALGGRSAQQTDLLLGTFGLGLVGELVRLPFVAAPAVVALEGAAAWAAIRRSLRLVRGYLGRTFGMVILARLLVVMVTAALVTPLAVAVNVASTATGFALQDTPLGPALPTVFALLTTCLTLPFEAVLWTLFYVDLRVRAEGLDVSLVDAVRRGEAG